MSKARIWSGVFMSAVLLLTMGLSLTVFQSPAGAQEKVQRRAAVQSQMQVRPGMLKPLSAEDKAKIDELLKSFDPNSYDFRYQVEDGSGKAQNVKVGKAKGLADLQQRNTVKSPAGQAAGTNTIINIFKQASTNTTINIFKEASTNTTINIFKERGLNDKAKELNSILQKYYVGE
jgi:hypothetical protein